MRMDTAQRVRRHSISLVVLLLLASVQYMAATTHIVLFGGALGLVYSPSSFSAFVGDTVQWQGSFSVHPLSSVSVPAGAASFSNTTGTVFNYVVTVPGAYTYQCDVHAGSGMVGSFDVSPTGVNDQSNSLKPTVFRLDQNYPNPFNPSTMIMYTVGGTRGSGLGTRKTMIVVYDLLGRQVATLVNEEKAPGFYEVSFDGSGLASGVYVYRLTAGSFVETKKMILVK